MTKITNLTQQNLGAFNGDIALKAELEKLIREAVEEGRISQFFNPTTSSKYAGSPCLSLMNQNDIYTFLSHKYAIPKDVFALLEALYIRLPSKDANRYTVSFIDSIRVGKDLSTYLRNVIDDYARHIAKPALHHKKRPKTVAKLIKIIEGNEHHVLRVADAAIGTLYDLPNAIDKVA